MHIEKVGYIPIRKQDYQELYNEITKIDKYAQLHEETHEIVVENSLEISSFIKSRLEHFEKIDVINSCDKFIIFW